MGASCGLVEGLGALSGRMEPPRPGWPASYLYHPAYCVLEAFACFSLFASEQTWNVALPYRQKMTLTQAGLAGAE